MSMSQLHKAFARAKNLRLGTRDDANSIVSVLVRRKELDYRYGQDSTLLPSTNTEAGSSGSSYSHFEL
jgi:hypothetical protein